MTKISGIAEKLAKEVIKDMKDGAEWSVYPLCEQAIAEARISALEEVENRLWVLGYGNSIIADAVRALIERKD